jgi:hypothetical protein
MLPVLYLFYQPHLRINIVGAAELPVDGFFPVLAVVGLLAGRVLKAFGNAAAVAGACAR